MRFSRLFVLPVTALLAVFLNQSATAADTTDPTCKIAAAYTQKKGNNELFTFFVKATDDVAVKKLQYRARVNGGVLGDWTDYPFPLPDQGLQITVHCNFFHFEVRAVDTSGHTSGAAVREFQAPFANNPPPPAGPKFAPVSQLTTSGTTPRGLVLADVDRDGKRDLVYLDHLAGQVTIERNDGTGMSFVKTDVPIGTGNLQPDSLAVGRVAAPLVSGSAAAENDQLPDLVIAAGATIHVLTNTGAAGSVSFAEEIASLSDPDAYLDRVAVGDVNGDGFDDIVATGSKYFDAPVIGRVAIFLNQGAAGGFNPTPQIFNIGRGIPDGVVVGDLFGDALPEIAVLGFNTSSQPVLSIFANSGGTFASPSLHYLNSRGRGLALADLSSDGVNDLAIVEVNSQSLDFEFFENLGGGSFYIGQPYTLVNANGGLPSSLRCGIAISDVTLDGNVDVVIADPLLGGATVARFKQSFDAQTHEFYGLTLQFPITPNPTAPNAQLIAIGDLDGDSKPDVVTANASSHNLNVLINRKTGEVQSAAILGVGATTDPAPGDIGFGANIRYTVTYSNNGIEPSGAATLYCDIPTNAKFLDADPGYTLAKKNKKVVGLQWPVGGLAVNDTDYRTFRVTVDPGADPNSQLTGICRVSSPTANTDIEDLPVFTVISPVKFTATAIPASWLSSSETHNGDTILYKLQYQNVSPSTVQNVQISSGIPKHTVLALDQNGNPDVSNATLHFSHGAPSLVWNLGNLGSGESGFRTFRVTVDDKIPVNDDLSGNASLQATAIAKFNVPLPNLTVRNPLQVTLARDPSSPLNPRPGEVILLNYQVSNKASKPMNDVKLTARIPRGTTFAYQIGGGFLNNLGQVEFDLGNLAACQTTTVSVGLLVLYDTELQSRIYAGNPDADSIKRPNGEPYFKGFDLAAERTGFRVTADDPATNNPPKNPDYQATAPETFNFEVASTAPTAAPRLGLLQFADADGQVRNEALGDIATVILPTDPPALPGEITYHFYYFNDGTADAHGVKLRGHIPARTTFVPNSYYVDDNPNQPPPNGSFETFAPNFFELTIGDLPAGSARTFSFKVKVDEGQRYGLIDLNDTKLLSADFLQPAEATPGTLTTQIAPPVSFDIETRTSKTAIDFSNPGEDGIVEYFVDYVNEGGVSASEVQLIFPIPTGGTYLSHRFVDADHVAEVADTSTKRSNTGARVAIFDITPMAAFEGRSLAVRVQYSATASYPKGVAQLDAQIKGRYLAPGGHSISRARNGATLPPASANFIETLAIFPQKPAHLWIGKMAPASLHPGDLLPISIVFGNSGNLPATGVKIGLQIPYGTKLAGEENASIANGKLVSKDAAATDLPKRWDLRKGIITWNIGDLPAHSSGAVKVLLRIDSKFGDCSITDNSCYISAAGIVTSRVPGPISIHVRSGNFFAALWENVGCWFAGFGSALEVAQKNAAFSGDVQQIFEGSGVQTFGGADLVVLRSQNGKYGSSLIANGDGQIVAAGAGNIVAAGAGNVISTDGSSLINQGGSSIVAAGAGNIVSIKDIDGGLGGTRDAAQILANADNIVAQGGGNIIAARGLNVISTDGSSLISNDGGVARGIVANKANIVAAGAGNIVAAGAGNIVAAGGGNLVGGSGGTFNLIGNAFGRIFNVTGSQIVAAGAGNVISTDGSSIVANHGNSLISNDGGGIVAQGAGN